MTAELTTAQLRHELAELRAAEVDLRRENAALREDRARLTGAIETLVHDEVISASRARELHGMTPEEQRQHWRDMLRDGRRPPRGLRPADQIPDCTKCDHSISKHGVPHCRGMRPDGLDVCQCDSWRPPFDDTARGKAGE